MSTQSQPVGLTCSDGILLFYLFSLAHSTLEILYHGQSFAECAKPIHVWLVVSYVSLVGLRIPHYLRQYGSELGEAYDGTSDGSGSWKGISKICLMVVWFVLLPFFIVWTVVGSFWLSEVLEKTPTCLPVGTEPRFIIFWQVVCYLWIIIYSACVALALTLRRRQQQTAIDVRAIESTDTQSRWGAITTGWGLSPLLGLNHKQIEMLPACSGSQCDESECSICLSAVEEGDSLRRLPACGHHFHQACIDLWLLRQNKCPLCKTDVLAKV